MVDCQVVVGMLIKLLGFGSNDPTYSGAAVALVNF